MFFEKRLTCMKRYSGSLVIVNFYFTVNSVPSLYRTVSSFIVVPSYFFSKLIRDTWGSVDNSYCSLNKGWFGTSKLKKKNFTDFFSMS